MNEEINSDVKHRIVAQAAEKLMIEIGKIIDAKTEMQSESISDSVSYISDKLSMIEKHIEQVEEKSRSVLEENKKLEDENSSLIIALWEISQVVKGGKGVQERTATERL